MSILNVPCLTENYQVLINSVFYVVFGICVRQNKDRLEVGSML